MRTIHRLIAAALLVLASASCSKLLDNLSNQKEDEPVSVPVSMEYDGVYFKEDLDERTSSQYYLRKESFSFFISTHFSGAMTLRMLVSSPDGFELDRWYPIPTEETENVWESFAEIEHNGAIKKTEDIAVSGKIRFTDFEQKGDLKMTGEGYCSIKGEFELTVADTKQQDKTVKITKGSFEVPNSSYWDCRAMED